MHPIRTHSIIRSFMFGLLLVVLLVPFSSTRAQTSDEAFNRPSATPAPAYTNEVDTGIVDREQQAYDAQKPQFTPLVGLPGLTDNSEDRSLADYLNALFRLAIGLAALLAVIKIVIAGIKYMSTDAFGGKEEAKKDIRGALLGLLLILSTVLILSTIYPGILKLNFLQSLPPIQYEPSSKKTDSNPQPGELQTSTPPADGIELKEDEIILSSQELRYLNSTGASPEVAEKIRAFAKQCAGKFQRRQTTANGLQGTVIDRLYCIGTRAEDTTSTNALQNQNESVFEAEQEVGIYTSDRDELIRLYGTDTPDTLALPAGREADFTVTIPSENQERFVEQAQAACSGTIALRADTATCVVQTGTNTLNSDDMAPYIGPGDAEPPPPPEPGDNSDTPRTPTQPDPDDEAVVQPAEPEGGACSWWNLICRLRN